MFKRAIHKRDPTKGAGVFLVHKLGKAFHAKGVITTQDDLALAFAILDSFVANGALRRWLRNSALRLKHIQRQRREVSFIESFPHIGRSVGAFREVIDAMTLIVGQKLIHYDTML